MERQHAPAISERYPTADHVGQLLDQHGRQKRKLRLSLTDRCNFRCGYCMPANPEWLPREQTLRQEEFIQLSKVFVEELGITHIRLTGGEPLLRKDVVEITSGINQLRNRGLQKLSMTSNGVLLPKYAQRLAGAGLDDINISLDSVNPKLFEELTRGGKLDDVERGIDAALAANLPVKINAVVIKGYNDGEVLSLFNWAVARGVTLRYIEFMPLDGNNAWSQEQVVNQQEMLDAIAVQHPVLAMPADSSPARRFTANGSEFGIISTVSTPFCSRCDRVRVTATGELYSCLFGANGSDLRQYLRSDNQAALIDSIRAKVWNKQKGYAQTGYVERPVTMHRMGG